MFRAEGIYKAIYSYVSFHGHDRCDMAVILALGSGRITAVRKMGFVETSL